MNIIIPPPPPISVLAPALRSNVEIWASLALSQTEIWQTKIQFIYEANQNRRMEETSEQLCTVHNSFTLFTKVHLKLYSCSSRQAE